jgi:hypothetical protein
MEHSTDASFQVGRIEKEYPIVDAHRGPCLEVAWSPFNDNVIARSVVAVTRQSDLLMRLQLLRRLLRQGVADTRGRPVAQHEGTDRGTQWPSKTSEYDHLASDCQQRPAHCRFDGLILGTEHSN